MKHKLESRFPEEISVISDMQMTPPLWQKTKIMASGPTHYLFNLYAEYIMRNARLDEAQTGIEISGRNINNLRYADDTTLMAESEEELKSLLMKGKRRVKKLA